MNKNIKTKCSEVTLDEFIDCLINGNYSRLGEATESELQQAWETLYSEYCKLSGNKTHAYYFDLYRQVMQMQAKLNLAREMFANPQNVDFEQLKQLGYRGSLNGIIAHLKAESIDLQTRQNELEKLKAKNESGTVSEESFTEWIIQVGKYLGYPVKRNEMLLSEFLTANRLMIKEAEAVRKVRK
jgi:hypothetical protein